MNVRITLLLFAFILYGCTDETINDNPKKINIKNSEEYQLDLGLLKSFYNTDGIVEANITLQASHYRKSEVHYIISGLGQTDNAIYRYLASENFVGKDYVEITLCKSLECAETGSKKEIVKIEFTVSN